MNITVWDDDTDAAKRWGQDLKDALGGDVDVQTHAADEIEKELLVLHERRKEYLKSGGPVEVGSLVLDRTDILIVDNDLFHLPNFNDLTAETVAARAGVYSSCGYIVVLNLRPDLDFDLTLLGDTGSKADLHINDKFVADPGLWKVCPNGGVFRPWHWPLLLEAVVSYRRRVDDLVKLLNSGDRDRPILKYLGFEKSAVSRLSRSARAFLHPTIPETEVSFRSFVAGNAQAVNVKDGEVIFEKNDVRRMARVGARRIHQWLSRLVVGPQEVLIDLPHLLERAPFVLREDQRGSKEGWNSFASLHEAPIELVSKRLGIEEAGLGAWIDRPVFWSDKLETEDNADRFFANPEANPSGFVFCEDASAFFESESCEEFVASHNSMSDRRFVRWFGDEEMDIKYGPQSRLAF